jgi:hypothetical protein
MCGRWRVALAGVALVAATNVAAAAQTTRITAAGFTGSVGTATGADFAAGFRQAASDVTLTVLNVANAAARTYRIDIFCAAATLGGTKPVSDLEWRRTDLTAWNPMSTTPTLVQSGAVPGVGASVATGVRLRMRLNFATDVPATYSATVSYRLTITTP